MSPSPESLTAYILIINLGSVHWNHSDNLTFALSSFSLAGKLSLESRSSEVSVANVSVTTGSSRLEAVLVVRIMTDLLGPAAVAAQVFGLVAFGGDGVMLVERLLLETFLKKSKLERSLLAAREILWISEYSSSICRIYKCFYHLVIFYEV